ncbi:MAG TPA: PAS domain S-box protein [Terriglobales bacterium]|nr:PAS domain S-box protein [Terriglobales bacterium]
MEIVRLYVEFQLLLTLFLVVLLWSLYFRVGRQQFFCWWAWAWTSFGVFIVLRTQVLQSSSLPTAWNNCLLLLLPISSFVQVPLLVLGAWSLLRSRRPSMRMVAFSLGAAAGAALLAFAVTLHWREHETLSVAVRFLPRELGLMGALLFCTYVFARRWLNTRSLASAMIAFFCLLCAFELTGHTWIYVHRLLLHLSTPPTMETASKLISANPRLYFVGIFSLYGISLGMVLLVIEENTRAERALWESNNQVLEIAANNARLQAEIEERERAETALRESEDRYRDLVENSQDLICTHDLEGKLLSVNSAPARILGYEPEELLRLSLLDLIAPEYRSSFGDYLARIQSAGADDGYLCVMTRSGERRVWEYHNTLRTNGIPAPIIRGMAHDVTERKKAEHALRETEGQLRQSHKMEAVGRLAGGIAHDFNNFLLGITLNIEQALRRLTPVDHTVMDYLDQALDAALSAASLTRRLLTFSRRQAFQERPVRLNEVVSTTKGLLDRLSGENIRIELKLQDDLGLAHSDPLQIQQVMLNLVLNARDAMPEGGVVTIRTENFDLHEPPAHERFSTIPQPGLYVVLEVADTGGGMDEETMSHLFEPFFTTKQASASAGLGLPICFGIVTQSKGHISVRSAPGRGTVMRVYLPLMSPSAAEKEPVATADSLPEAVVPHVARTVLVVDDTEVVRNAVARDLRGVGYSVLTAANATQALLLSEQHKGPIDLLVADVVMPGMNGRELARHLARTRPQLKVVLMSGYDKETVECEGPVGASETLLYKPFSSLDLFTALGKLLDKEAA